MKRPIIFAILGLALSMPSTAFSQSSQSPPANFKGVVVDAHLGRIPKASVVIEGVDRKWNLETDEDGKAIGEINVELPAGKYKFTVEAPWFKRLVVMNFRVASGATIAYQFRLDVRSNDDHNILPPDKPEPVPVRAQPNKALQLTAR